MSCLKCVISQRIFIIRRSASVSNVSKPCCVPFKYSSRQESDNLPNKSIPNQLSSQVTSTSLQSRVFEVVSLLVDRPSRYAHDLYRIKMFRPGTVAFVASACLTTRRLLIFCGEFLPFLCTEHSVKQQSRACQNNRNISSSVNRKLCIASPLLCYNTSGDFEARHDAE